LVDGSSVGAVWSYTLDRVIANHTIVARFAAADHTLTATAGPNGSIEPSGTVGMEHGGTQKFTVIPSVDYEVEDVFVDGTSVGAAESYTFVDVREDHVIEVAFRAADDDDDGLPDRWEREVFGGLDSDGTGDEDGDGIDNAQEFANGTDPTTADIDARYTPVVRGPVSGGTVTMRYPELSVYNPIREDDVSLAFTFEVATDRQMTDIVFDEDGIAEGFGTTVWTPPGDLQDRSRYYWRARAQTGSASSEWTPVCTFYVDTGGDATVAGIAAAEYVVAGSPIIVEVTDEQHGIAGTVVDVPPDVLPRDFVLTIGTVKNAPSALGSPRVLGKVYEFGPHGVPFSQQVTILLPYTDQHLQGAGVEDPNALGVFHYNTETLEWEEVAVEGVDYMGQRLLFKVAHFSMYAIGAAETEPVATPPAAEPEAPASSDSDLSVQDGGGGGGGGGCFIQSLGM
jgi:hypothetical protein